MGLIDPRHPLFQGAATTSGPGIHTDEASAAIPKLRGKLAPHLLRELAVRSASSGDGVRSNPDDDDDEEYAERKGSDTILPRGEIFRMIYLVTGMWGPDAKHNERFIDRTGIERRRLPMTRMNPRSSIEFFQRMEALLADIRRLRTQAQKRMQELRIKKTDWVPALTRMEAGVQFVLAQAALPIEARSIMGSKGPLNIADSKGKSLLAKTVIARGNKKLNFVAYSELPMVTCPGAGTCGVRIDTYDERPGKDQPKAGFCYSFRAFRNPFAISRMFLSTLANYADREFAIGRGGGANLPESDYDGRVRAALRGSAGRVWPSYVTSLALNLTKKDRKDGKAVFLRLFVDGDLNYEDNIIAWMEAVLSIGPGSPFIEPGHGHLEVYGYSKCWQQLVNVDRMIGGQWPVNYRLNLSSGSVYISNKYEHIRRRVESLPISRGYFVAIPLKRYIKQLQQQTELLRENPNAPVPMPKPHEATHFAFDETRIRTFLRLNGVRTIEDAEAILGAGTILWPMNAKGAVKKMDADQVRKLAFEEYLNRLTDDPAFGALVRRELLRDKNPSTELTALRAYEERQKAVLAQALKSGGKANAEYSQKQLRDKTLALALHEVLWVYGLGGSCPLICGNCSDHPTDPSLGVHRCASKSPAFQDRGIHIGIH